VATNVGKLNVLITASAKGFIRGMDQAAKRTKIFGSGLKSNRMAMMAWGAGIAAGVSAVAALSKGLSMVVGQMERLDHLAKTSNKLGFSVEELQKLRYAGERTGVATRTLDMAMQRFTRRMAEAANGMGEARGALKELGIDAARFQGLGVEDQMKELADAFAKQTHQSDRLRLAFKLFDSEGAVMVNMLREGSGALEEYFRRAEKLGLATGDHAKKAEEYKDAVLDLTATWNHFKVELATQVAPTLIELTKNLTDFLEQAKNNGAIESLADSFSALAESARQAADAIGPVASAGKDFMDSKWGWLMPGAKLAGNWVKANKDNAKKKRELDEAFAQAEKNRIKRIEADKNAAGFAASMGGPGPAPTRHTPGVGTGGWIGAHLGSLARTVSGLAASAAKALTPVAKLNRDFSNPAALARGTAAAISKSLELRQQHRNRQNDPTIQAIEKQKREQVDAMNEIRDAVREYAPIIVGI